MIRALLYRLSSRLPCRIIADGDRPYLERYYVGTLLGVRCYIHRFVASDPDRGLHDHPWRWALSMIISGWYIEERRDRSHARRWLNFLVGDNFHRVIVPAGVRDVWTLFLHGERIKIWGFLRPLGPGIRTEHFQPYSYASDAGEDRKWWERAPLGCDETRRMPL